MKYLKILFLSISLLFLQHSYGQIVDIEKIISDDNFVKLEKLGIQFYTSENYKIEKKLDKQLIEYFPESYFKEMTKFEEWIKENLSKTKFTNLQEALDFYSNYRLIKRENDLKLKEIFSIQEHLSQLYGSGNIDYLFRERILGKVYLINNAIK